MKATLSDEAGVLHAIFARIQVQEEENLCQRETGTVTLEAHQLTAAKGCTCESAAGHFVLFLSLLLNIQEAGVSLKSRLSAPECATHGEPQQASVPVHVGSQSASSRVWCVTDGFTVCHTWPASMSINN